MHGSPSLPFPSVMMIHVAGIVSTFSQSHIFSCTYNFCTCVIMSNCWCLQISPWTSSGHRNWLCPYTEQTGCVRVSTYPLSIPPLSLDNNFLGFLPFPESFPYSYPGLWDYLSNELLALNLHLKVCFLGNPN